MKNIFKIIQTSKPASFENYRQAPKISPITVK